MNDLRVVKNAGPPPPRAHTQGAQSYTETLICLDVGDAVVIPCNGAPPQKVMKRLSSTVIRLKKRGYFFTMRSRESDDGEREVWIYRVEAKS